MQLIYSLLLIISVLLSFTFGLISGDNNISKNLNQGKQMSELKNFKNNNNDLEIIPSKTSSENDFDFLLGSWHIRNRKLKTRLNNCTEWDEFLAKGTLRKILRGIGNIDDFITTLDNEPFEGMSLRLFNPSTKLWSIYWADSRIGEMQIPVVGSFNGDIGEFYAEDIFAGKEILVKFNWDKTNPNAPVWSQAFSIDKGKTWEWNWYMYFEKVKEITENINTNIKVIELRNYFLKPGMLNSFTNYFKEHFIEPQNKLGAFTLGQFHIKDETDRFFWIRGFKDMCSRGEILRAFYEQSNVWKEFGPGANDMMLDSDNVHLLKPVNSVINENVFKKEKSIVVIDYYTANDNNLELLINLFQKKYVPFLNSINVNDITLWVSEMKENDFPRLPVFQNENLLVAITFYNDESDFKLKTKKNDSIDVGLKNDMQRLIAGTKSLVLYTAE